MAIVDASVYVALVHEGEAGHADSWAWLHAAQARREALRAPAILAAEVAAAISRGTANPELAHQIVVQLMTSNVVELIAVSTTSGGTRRSHRGGASSKGLRRRLRRSGGAHGRRPSDLGS